MSRARMDSFRSKDRPNQLLRRLFAKIRRVAIASRRKHEGAIQVLPGDARQICDVYISYPG